MLIIRGIILQVLFQFISILLIWESVEILIEKSLKKKKIT